METKKQELPPMTNEELLHYFQAHISYERDMLFGIACKIKEYEAERILYNAMWQSAAIHVRNLYEFFDSDPRKRHSDVQASHYLSPADTDALRGKVKRLLGKVKTQADKQVAHLTRERTDKPEHKQWDVNNMVSCVDQLFNDFIDGADKDKLPPILFKMHAALPHDNIATNVGLTQVGKHYKGKYSRGLS